MFDTPAKLDSSLTPPVEAQLWKNQVFEGLSFRVKQNGYDL